MTLLHGITVADCWVIRETHKMLYLSAGAGDPYSAPHTREVTAKQHGSHKVKLWRQTMIYMDVMKINNVNLVVCCIQKAVGQQPTVRYWMSQLRVWPVLQRMTYDKVQILALICEIVQQGAPKVNMVIYSMEGRENGWGKYKVSILYCCV